MAAVRLLVDTDILIDSLNTGRYSAVLEGGRHTIDYSIVTRKELLAKAGLKDAERQALRDALARFRLLPVTPAIAARYAAFRATSRGLEREDALIAATALEKRLPLMTRNWRHFRRVAGLALYGGP